MTELEPLQQLQQQIVARQATLAVIGLGYVGLPVACLFAKHGFNVIGVDVLADRVAEINAGISPIRGIEPGLADLVGEVVRSGKLRATTDYGVLAQAQVVLIAVDTPVTDDDHAPQYDRLRKALTLLGQQMQDGTLVIVESTIAPGTMQRVVAPALQGSSRLILGQDYWIGHCPERVMPGRLLNNLQKMDRVVGGMTPAVAEVMITLYRTYVEGTLDPAEMLTAELVKTGENAYRDVNIAFANDMALICEAVGGDFWKVRTLLNKSPGRNLLLPGTGVGGHCIPKDPWLLRYGAIDTYASTLIKTARSVNDAMPAHVADLVAGVLAECSVAIQGAKVAVLGYAYLENSDDTRNTPSAPLIEQLRTLGCIVVVHDPFVEAYQGDVWATLAGADCAAVVVAHTEYANLDLKRVAQTLNTPALVDSRHVYTAEQLTDAGLAYRIIGVGR